MAGNGRNMLPWVTLLIFVVPWIIMQAGIVIPADAAWLGDAAGKFLAGQAMSGAYLDNNPPMSILIYIPYALLRSAGVGPSAAILAYGVTVFFTFFGLLYGILRRNIGLTGTVLWGILSGYAAAILLIFQIEFANKDSFIAAAILPFILAQYCLTYRKWETSWLVRMAIVLAVPFILVKPHFGLLCVAMLAHRFFREKRLAIVFDFDFLALAAGVVIYAGLVWFWFPDYFSDVFKVFSIKLYALIPQDPVLISGPPIFLFALILSSIAMLMDGDQEKRRIAKLLGGASLLCAAIFIVQLKGFSVHMIPFLAVSIPAVFVNCSLYFRKLDSESAGMSAIVVACIMAAGLLFGVYNPATPIKTFKNADFYNYVVQRAEGSSFLMQTSTTNIIAQISAHSGIPHATRFASLWWIYELSKPRNAEFVPMVAEMVASDIEKYRPALIALVHSPPPDADILSLFSGDRNFQEAFSKYQKSDVVDIRQQQFFKRTIDADNSRFIGNIYDIYIREPVNR